MRQRSKVFWVLCTASAIVLIAGGLAHLMYPIVLSGALASAQAFFSSRLAAMTGRTGVMCLLMGAVLGIEMLTVGWRSSSLFRLFFQRSKSAIVDNLYFFYVLLKVSNFAEIGLTFGLSILASRVITYASSYYGWTRIELPSAGAFQLAIGFGMYWLLYTFFGYWGHRLMHHPLFWHLHRFHHAATELNIVTVFRQHPVEPVVLGLLGVVSPLIFFNASDDILFVAFLVGTTVDLLAHSQLPWSYGWLGRWIVASPRVHQIHHSIDEEHRDLHFSSCPLWDHLFGTWYKGTNAPSGFGIPDLAYEARPLRQLVLDTLIFYRDLTRWLVLPIRYLPSFRSDLPSIQ